MTANMFPSAVEIDSEFFGGEHAGERLVGKVIAIVRDSTGDQYCVFELADMAGLHVIHLGSNFFKGWSDEYGSETGGDVGARERFWRKHCSD